MNLVFKALADPTRREILQMLQAHNMTAGDIAKAFNITAPSISHHLSILKSADLVSVERDGQNLIYSLNSTIMQEFIQQLLEFFQVGEDHHETQS